MASFIEERALHQHIRRRTARLIDLTDKTLGGSAITIQLGGRYFLATAAHVIPSSHDIRVLVGEGHEEDISDFKAWHVDESDDVGLLELAQHIAPRIKKDFTDASQLIISLDQSDAWSATLVGYPGQLVKTESEQTPSTVRRTHSFRTLTLVTRLIPISKWPSAGTFQRRSPQQTCDLFVEFDSKTKLFEQNLTALDKDDQPVGMDCVDLAGMSGCGIWLDNYKVGNVWKPEPILAGIDTGVQPKQGWARGTLIRRWLALLVRHYPEFNTIEQQLNDHTV